jgi:hypothetical protein
VHLVSVTVTIDPGAPRGNGVGVLLERGCSGTIGRIDVTTALDDAIKVGDARNLRVNGGNLLCTGHGRRAHQDGIQVMSGENIVFSKMTVDCRSANNAAFFVNDVPQDSAPPPKDVLFEHGKLYGTTSTTVFVTDHQTGSGVESSQVCPSQLFTFRTGETAVDSGNVVAKAC